MSPLLMPGDEVLINLTAYRRRLPCLNDIVIVQHPYRNEVKIIKRITRILEDGRYYLEGDNPQESTDSRAFGAVAFDKILGQVTSIF